MNSLSLIPVLNHIAAHFSHVAKEVEVNDCSIADFNKKLNGVIVKPLFAFSNFNAFRKQRLNTQRKKYSRLIRVLWESLGTNKVIYTADHQVLFLFFLLCRLRKKRCKLVYHQFEVLEPELLNSSNRFMWKYVLKNSRFIDLFICPEKNRMNYFIHEASFPESRSLLFANTCVTAFENKYAKRPSFLNDLPPNFHVCAHIGNVGPNHFLDTFIEVVESNADQPVFFIMLGRYDDSITKKLACIKNKNFRVLEAVSHDTLLQIYPFIDFGCILYKGVDRNFEFCAPNKLYEYLAYGIPVFAHSLKGLRDLELPGNMLMLEDFSDNRAVGNINEFLQKPVNKDAIRQYFDQKLAIGNEFKKLDNKINELIDA